MTLIILDTNILLSIFELKYDILDDIEMQYGKKALATISIVEDELKTKGKKGQMALKLLQKKEIPIIQYEGEYTADDAILDFCVKNTAILATQDRQLQQRAKNKHLKTLKIRQKAYLS